MSFRITMPFGMELIDWADQITMDLDAYGVIGKLESEFYWQDWAAGLINNTDIPDNVPNPYMFSDWRDWAERLCQVLS